LIVIRIAKSVLSEASNWADVAIRSRGSGVIATTLTGCKDWIFIRLPMQDIVLLHENNVSVASHERRRLNRVPD
jgi:hypothetical protein